jgi:hypothetical protein
VDSTFSPELLILIGVAASMRDLLSSRPRRFAHAVAKLSQRLAEVSGLRRAGKPALGGGALSYRLKIAIFVLRFHIYAESEHGFRDLVRVGAGSRWRLGPPARR